MALAYDGPRERLPENFVEWRSARWFAPALAELPETLAARLWEARAAFDPGEHYAPRPGELSRQGVQNECLKNTLSRLKKAPLSKAYDLSCVRYYARRLAARCELLSKTAIQWLCERLGVPLPRTNGRMRGLRFTACSARWWTRQLRRMYLREAENALRSANLIHRRADPYCSREALALQRERRRGFRAFLEAGRLVEVETGQTLEMLDVHGASVADPAVRRAEFMNRLKGFELCALAKNHAAVFFTLTAPSAYHATLADGTPNPRFEGKTVQDAQTWHRAQWARARAAIARRSVHMYGFRIAEPHHDATVHWHMLLFCKPGDVDALSRLICGRWLAEYADEPGAREHRARVETIDLQRVGKDGRRTGAVGYLAKYVAKNIDGFQLKHDDPAETDLLGDEAAMRVDAWAKAQTIRQFQQIGGPSVTLWREFRRLREKLPYPDVEAIRERVDAGDWLGFIEALGGIEAGRSRFVRVVTDRETDPMWSMVDYLRAEADQPPPPVRIVGIQAVIRVAHEVVTQVIATRVGRWKLLFKGGSFFPWTRGNNCTRHDAVAGSDGARAWLLEPEPCPT